MWRRFTAWIGKGDPWVELGAGLTVSLVSLPQCLAYAMMSGLPPEYGLVTAAIPGLVAALLGHSVQIITGPTNTTGLLILRTLTPFLAANGLLGAAGLPTLATLTLMAGLLRLALAALGGATLLRFIPESVLVGFGAGAGVLIAVMQLDEALGLAPTSGSSMWAQLNAIAAALSRGQLVPSALVLTLLTVGLMALGKRRLPKAPTALLTILGLTGAAWAMGDRLGVALVRDRSPVPSGWPALAMPTLELELITQLFVPACAIVLLGTLELTVSVRAEDGEQRMRREITAQGFANIVGAFVGAFPASASLTRSALLRLGGARTRIAGLVAALSLLPILFFGGQAVGYIPQAALAGVLWVTAWSMIKRERMARIWRASLASRNLLIVTFLATLILPLEWAIFLGVGLGLLLHLGQNARARVRFWRVGPAQEAVALERLDGLSHQDTLIVEISGSFHYAAVQQFREELAQELPSEPARVIFDLSHAHHMRFAAVLALEQLHAQLEARGQQLILCGVSEPFGQILAQTEAKVQWFVQSPSPSACALALSQHEHSANA